MTVETVDEPDGVLPDDLRAARTAAWVEHQRRCADNEPYTDGVTMEALPSARTACARQGTRLRLSRRVMLLL